MKNWTHEFLGKMVIEGHDVFVSPHGFFGYTPPGKFFTLLGVNNRPHHIFRKDLDPLNHASLLNQLQNYFSTLLRPGNIEAYVNHFYAALVIFLNEAKVFSLVETYYEKLSLPNKKTLEQFKIQLKNENIPLQRSSLFAEIQEPLTQEYMKGEESDREQYVHTLRGLFSDKMQSIFGPMNEGRLEVFLDDITAGREDQAKNAIRQWHQQGIKRGSKDLEGLINNIRAFVRYNYTGSETVVEAIRAYFLLPLNHLLGNSEIAPIVKLGLSSPTMRILIAKGQDTRSLLISSVGEFTHGPQAAHLGGDQTIILPYSGKAFPFPLCTFQRINGTGSYYPNMVEIMYDELMHAAVHILYPGEAGLPYGNEHQKESYLGAREHDTRRLESIQHKIHNNPLEKTLAMKITAAIAGHVDPQSGPKLLVYDNSPELIRRLNGHQEGDYVQWPDAKPFFIIQSIPGPNHWGGDGVVLALPQAVRSLNAADYFELMREALRDAVSAFTESGSDFYKGIEADVQEFLNRLILPKWGSAVTALFMPHLYKYYKEHLLEPCKLALANMGLPANHRGGAECSSSYAFGCAAAQSLLSAEESSPLPGSFHSDPSSALALAMVPFGYYSVSGYDVAYSMDTDYWGRSIFIVKVFPLLERGPQLGELVLHGSASPCMLPDGTGSNIVKAEGVFAPGGVEWKALRDEASAHICGAFPKTWREHAVEGAQQGLCGGLSKVFQYYCRCTGDSKTRAFVKGQLSYFTLTFMCRFSTYFIAASAFFSLFESMCIAFSKSLIEATLLSVIYLFCLALSMGLDYVARGAANQEWRLTSKACDVASWSIGKASYAYVGCTAGLRSAAASLFGGVATSVPVEWAGKAVVNRYMRT